MVNLNVSVSSNKKSGLFSLIDKPIKPHTEQTLQRTRVVGSLSLTDHPRR
jgi:hypothetical protein